MAHKTVSERSFSVGKSASEKCCPFVRTWNFILGLEILHEIKKLKSNALNRLGSPPDMPMIASWSISSTAFEYKSKYKFISTNKKRIAYKILLN